MAENFNDYGDYSSELAYEAKSKRGKFFSFRTLGKTLKWLFYALIIFIYVFFTYRLIEDKSVGKYTDLLWSPAAFEAFAQEETDFLVYSYDVEYQYAYDSSGTSQSDGKFSVYGMRYFPAVSELQFTIRYNKSTVETLAQEYDLADLQGEMPFRFVLQDDYGDLYENAVYKVYTRGRYTYVRISFSGVTLFAKGSTSPEKAYPVGQAPVAAYIYKGASRYEQAAGTVSSLHLKMYYAEDYAPGDDSFGIPICVYKDTYELTPYSLAKEKPSAPTEETVTVRTDN